MAVAAQYTADFPHPVACTTSTLAPRSACGGGAQRAATASTWSLRSEAAGPATLAMTSSATDRCRSVSDGSVGEGVDADVIPGTVASDWDIGGGPDRRAGPPAGRAGRFGGR